MAITKPPRQVKADPAAIESFIAGGLDKAGTSAPAPMPAPAPAARAAEPRRASGGRKQSISLTIDPALLVELDREAANLGISRAAAFSLAVSRFVASEKRGAQ